MAKNLADPGASSSPADPPPKTWTEVAAFSATQDADAPAGAPATSAASPTATSAAPATSPTPAPTHDDAKPETKAAPAVRYLMALANEIYHALAGHPDPMSLEEVGKAVNEALPDGTKKPFAAKGPIEKLLRNLVDMKRVETSSKPSGGEKGGETILYALTTQSRTELDSPALVHGARQVVVAILAAGLLYPTREYRGQLTAGMIAYAYAQANTAGGPTLPADLVLCAHADIAITDVPMILARVTGHLDRLHAEGLVEEVLTEEQQAERDLADAAKALKDSGEVKVKPAADERPAPTTPTPYKLTQKASALFVEGGAKAVVDLTFPAKPPAPTLEELTKSAEAAAKSQIDTARAAEQHWKIVAAQHEQSARDQRERVIAVIAWMRAMRIRDPEQVVEAAINKNLRSAPGFEFEIFTFEEETTLTNDVAMRIQTEIDALVAEGLRIKASHENQTKAMKGIEGEIATKVADLQAAMSAWARKERFTFTVKKRARSLVEGGELIIVSVEEHDKGRILRRGPIPSGTQTAMPGAGPAAGPVIVPPGTTAGAPVAAPAAAPASPTPGPSPTVAGPVPTPPAPATYSGPTLKLTVQGLADAFTTFMADKPAGVLSSVIEREFFSFCKLPPSEAVGFAHAFTKVLAAADKAKAVFGVHDDAAKATLWRAMAFKPAPVPKEKKSADPKAKPLKPPVKTKPAGKAAARKR